LIHEVEVDRRHAPDDGFDGAAVEHALGEFGRTEGSRRFRCFLLAVGCDEQCAEQSNRPEHGAGRTNDTLFHGVEWVWIK
jgi:hypothetical protein